MMDGPTLQLLALVGAASLLAGVGLTLWWSRRLARQRKRLPKHWPLDPRAVTSSHERMVWHWLGRVFFDHHIMVKMPVTRFTLPADKQNGARWYELLSGVYCTFTVCGSDGQVVGCVDVVGPRGISRSNRQLKLSLLSQCGIAYLVVKRDNLPTAKDIRFEFLGESGAPEQGVQDGAMAMTAQKLRTAMHRMRDQRLGDASRLEPDSGHSTGSGGESVLPDSGFSPSSWQQADSFIAPLTENSQRLRH